MVLSGADVTEEEADKILATREMQKEENLKKATILLSRSQNIKDYTNIPSKIKPGELNQTPIVHPKLKNYDPLGRMPTISIVG